MDVFSLLEDLEETVDRGAKIPMTSRVLVDEEAIFNLIDKIRNHLPEELRQAKWVTKERDRILAEAQAEAEKVVEQGRTYITKMVEDSEVVNQAQAYAEELVNQSRKVAREIRSGANAYADEMLCKVENSLLGLVESLRQDRQQLAAESASK
ncbi:MAG: ATPase [Peptococcaceae bacterium]|nr:ATPase [Peptococcaceae bacterium]